jgi:gamma-glutamylcyclotransferase (GGCT)/AIG2-like uncharacterized protein YtfP
MRNLKEILDISEKEFANLQNLKKLDAYLRDKYRNEFPIEICQLANLEELEIYGEFTKLPKEFSNLQKLKKLNIHSNVKDFAILQQLSNLESLDISTGEKKNISIKNLTNLKSISILSFQSAEISNLPNLQKISSKLEKLKTSNLPNLEEIEIEIEADNFEIPNELKKQLQKISLRYYQGEINLSDFTNLKQLDIDESSCSIVGNTDLKLLSIKDSHSITNLPEFKNLEELYIHNATSKLKPTKIFRNFPILKKLKKVSLCNNNCPEEFPKWIRELSELEYLHISEYCFTEIPDWIDELQNLKEISIEWSNLQKVSEAVTNLKNLEKLHLNINHIEEYPQNLEKLSNLKELEIETGKISFEEYNRIQRALPNTKICNKRIGIFVIDSLKKGFANHYILENMEFLGKATTEEKYPMILQNEIPYLIAQSGIGKNIRGEVYEIDSEMLEKLDVLYSDDFIRKDFKVKLDDEFSPYWRYVTAYIPNFKIDFFKFDFLSEFTTGQISTNLFVYGNIKKGFENHHLLENSEFIGEGVLKQFRYEETNSQNFGMIIRNSKLYLFSKDDYLPNRSYNIKGEVYKISVKDLKKFVFLEEQDYIKTEIRVEVDKEEKLYAIAFIANFTIQYSADELLEEFKN